MQIVFVAFFVFALAFIMSHDQMFFVLNEYMLLKSASKRSCFLCVVMINIDAALILVIYQLHGVGDGV